MSLPGRTVLLVLGLIAPLLMAEHAEANLCLHLTIAQRALNEAAALRDEFGVVLPDDPDTARTRARRCGRGASTTRV